MSSLISRAHLPIWALVCLALLSSPYVAAEELTRLGAVITDLTAAESLSLGGSNTSGVYVVSVVANGPAASAGILPRDVIEKLDDNLIGGVQDLQCDLLRRKPGSIVRITVLRDKHLKIIAVALGRWPLGSTPPIDRARCGVVLTDPQIGGSRSAFSNAPAQQ
jgi:hypothetical protein